MKEKLVSDRSLYRITTYGGFHVKFLSIQSFRCKEAREAVDYYLYSLDLLVYKPVLRGVKLKSGQVSVIKMDNMSLQLEVQKMKLQAAWLKDIISLIINGKQCQVSTRHATAPAAAS